MERLDIEFPANREGKWAAEMITCPDCGVRAAHVYPAELERIECECRAWIETALGARKRQAQESVN